MNKTELIEQVANKAGISKKGADTFISAFFTCVEDVLQAGDKVQLVGFGTFEVRERQERNGRNPQNGEIIHIPAARVPAFKAGKDFKNAVK
ncbi:MAG: HU family DNA-binding protein [Syntrophomonadaceae bacterium]|jgi:DNA-binding protein HU-beta|nr:HU family DNA-binding protein [Syntrophomonadaceae bacterium]